VVPLLNAAPLEEVTRRECSDELALYWRNYTIDLGPRGPDDILKAMPLLPLNVRLYLQGFPSRHNAGRVEQMIRELGIQERVTLLAPYRIEDAVKAAVPYCVGLSLQSPSIANMNLSSTNKFFEYAMAGLAIVSSKTAAHRDLVTSQHLGLLYESGDAEDLARQIRRLCEDRALLAAMRANARRYAESEGNLEFQMQRFREAFRERVLPLLERG
jgi:glycosyltransferase involved in cell wall biosynthesis